jgi:soluble lytic murein transglycosylase-like protein
VARYHGVPPYAETQAYVDKVQALYARYRSALRQARPTGS